MANYSMFASGHQWTFGDVRATSALRQLMPTVCYYVRALESENWNSSSRIVLSGASIPIRGINSHEKVWVGKSVGRSVGTAHFDAAFL